MGSGKKESSLVVFIGFILLFLLFLFVGPKEKSGNAIIGSTVLGENPSMMTIIILFVILIIILIAVFVIFKKIKKKKMMKGENPKLGDKEVSKGDMEEADIERLFSEDSEIKPEAKKEPSIDIGSSLGKNEEHLDFKPKEPLTNLQEVKDRVKGMLSQNFSKNQITTDLKSEGMSENQINKILGDINLDNLRAYVDQSLKRGVTKDQISRDLMAHGWKQEQISKVM